ncbi:hypothetical protein MPC4_130097 [Methylocella tundrae]|uniref:Uncharacterized protein n=1 Tax=Methylocella tundrae TaxID=227605 RepID=A0A8B6M2L1_METTU|nr:hypothetical protein MPC1_2980003 [Methylocella tundrae]VTZ49076.1 hypothetical protein MPC4_130097 [Methylocella tundrae]
MLRDGALGGGVQSPSPAPRVVFMPDPQTLLRQPKYDDGHHTLTDEKLKGSIRLRRAAQAEARKARFLRTPTSDSPAGPLPSPVAFSKLILRARRRLSFCSVPRGRSRIAWPIKKTPLIAQPKAKG